MPDISVSPDQRERLRWIQRRLEEDIEYGHVRPADALDFLLDHAESTGGLRDVTADGGDAADAADATDATDAAASQTTEPTADVESEGTSTTRPTIPTLEPKLVETVSVDAAEADAPAAVDGVDDEADDDGDTEPDDESDTGVDESDTESDDQNEADGQRDTESDDDSDTQSASPPTLNAMMSLLETHDDKWRTADSGEEKYEVDLPDGSTAGARTKDDVKAVLFKQYR